MIASVQEPPAIFKAGEEVEVRCDDEGFKNAWYEARVIRRISKRRRYSVVYDSLADESDESRPLVEEVSASHMRPRPPRPRTSGGCRICLHQLVDAFYNDGWWAGEVVKTPKKPGAGRYTVCFPDTGEEMAFKPSVLRPHLEWIEGEWVRRQTFTDKPIKSPKLGGARTEHHEQPSANITWKPKVPTTIKRLSGADNEALTKLHIHSTNSAIKNREPCNKSDNGETIEDNAWLIECLARCAKTSNSVKTGCTVTSATLEERPNFRLQTFLNDKFHCSISPFSEKSVEILNVGTEAPPKTLLIHDEPLMPANFNRESLVPHTPLGEIKRSDKGEEITELGCKGSESQSKTPDCSHISHDTSNFFGMVMQGQSEGVCCPVGDGQQSKTLAYRDQFQQREVLHGGDVGEHKRGKKRKKSIPRKVTILDRKPSSEGNELQQLDGIDDARIGREYIMEEVDKSVIDDHSSISHEIQLLCHGNKETNHADALCTVNREGDSVGDRQDNALIGEPSLEGHSTSQTELVTPGEACIKGVRVQALSETMVGSFSSILLGTSISHHKARSEARNESLLSTSRVPVEGALTGPMSGKVPSEKSYLPFQKRSSIWEFIDSTESKISQPPHFRPLEQYCEDLREGMAIGLMVTFSSLVKSIGDLKIYDSLDKFDEKVKTFIHLEEHGFDVQYARARLEELLRIKSNHGQVVEKISSLKVVISGKEKDRDRLNAEIEATEKAAMALQQTLAHLYEKKKSLLRKKEENDSDMVKLQMDSKVVEEMFQSAEHDFKGVVAAEW